MVVAAVGIQGPRKNSHLVTCNVSVPWIPEIVVIEVYYQKKENIALSSKVNYFFPNLGGTERTKLLTSGVEKSGMHMATVLLVFNSTVDGSISPCTIPMLCNL